MPPDFPPGQFLFHYTTREAAFGHIVPSGSLRLSPYSEMRDPLENQQWWPFLGGYWPGSLEESGKSSDDGDRAYMEFLWRTKEAKDGAKLLAMTTDADDYEDPQSEFARGWARARMWEQYAEQHSGVCLVFQKEILTKTITAALKEVGAVVYGGPVRYSNGGFAEEAGARHLDIGSIALGDIRKAAARHLNDHHESLFFLKTVEWKTEYEFRIVALTAADGYLPISYGDALAAIILGHKFPPWQRPAAMGAATDAGVELRRCDWSMSRPVLAGVSPPATRKQRADFRGLLDEQA